MTMPKPWIVFVVTLVTQGAMFVLVDTAESVNLGFLLLPYVPFASLGWFMGPWGIFIGTAVGAVLYSLILEALGRWMARAFRVDGH